MNDYVGNRLSLRFSYKLKIKIKGRRFKETQFMTSDISATGLFVPSDKAPALGLPLDIKIYLPNNKKAISLKGKVLRIKWAGNFDYVEGFAVEFKKIERTAEDRLLNFLNKIDKGEI